MWRSRTVADTTRSKTTLNEKQLEFVRKPQMDGTLIGIPGGGKTQCVLERVLFLHEKGIESLVLTFGNAARDDFRNKGKRLRPDVFTQERNANLVRTLHSLAGTILDQDNVWLKTAVYRAAEKLRPMTGTKLREAIPWLANVGSIVVDEAQDISETQYELVCALKETLDVPLVLVGDPNQAIYAFQDGDARFLLNHSKNGGFCVRLTKNYRSTPALVDVGNAAAPSGPKNMVAASGKTGDRPTLISAEPSELKKRLVKIVRDALKARPRRSVAILGPVKQSFQPHTNFMSKLGLQWGADALESAYIKVDRFYSEESGFYQDYSRHHRAKKRHDAVTVSTLHGAKGLEFDTVIILNFHHKLMGRNPTMENMTDLRNLVYVGLTRPESHLYLFHDKNSAVWQDLFNYKHLFDIEGDVNLAAKEVTYAASEEEHRELWPWTQLLKDNVVLPEKKLAHLEDLLAIPVPGRSGRQQREPVLPDEAKIASLYGEWAENTFFHGYRGEAPPVLRRIEAMLYNLVRVPATMTYGLRLLRKRLGLKNTDLVHKTAVNVYRAKLAADKSTAPLLDYLDTEVFREGREEVFLDEKLDCRWFVTTELRDLTARARAACPDGRIEREDMWHMCLFIWQYDFEARWRWFKDYSRHLKGLERYEAGILAEAAALPDGYEFQVECKLVCEDGTEVRGFVDAVHRDSGTLLELKFTREYDLSHAIQAVGYAVMLDPPKLGLPWKVDVVGLRTGRTTRVDSAALRDPEPTRTFLKKLVERPA